jgi:AcrR family transcriptional regulator
MLVEDQMAKQTAWQLRPRKRAEQQRSIETRASILNAAIAEFAERGFEGASIRAIADRLGLQHPLITYHYRSKDILWRAAAEYAFAQIRSDWDISAPEGSDLSPLARLRQEYTTLFRYTLAFPEFHRFMRQEALTNNPRLKWVAETVLTPLLGRLLGADCHPKTQRLPKRIGVWLSRWSSAKSRNPSEKRSTAEGKC